MSNSIISIFKILSQFVIPKTHEVGASIVIYCHFTHEEIEVLKRLINNLSKVLSQNVAGLEKYLSLSVLKALNQ